MIDTAHNQGNISTVLQLPANTVPPATRQRLAVVAATAVAPAAVSYKLRLLDPNGGVLLERPITLQPLDDHEADEDAALFSDLFTPPAGQVATIELLADDTVLDVIRPGLHAPAVSDPAAHSGCPGGQLAHDPVDGRRPRPAGPPALHGPVQPRWRHQLAHHCA